MLGAALLGAAAVGAFGANYLLDALQTCPYASLFTVALYGGIPLWIATAAVGVWWYAVRLNDIKRLLRLTDDLA